MNNQFVNPVTVIKERCATVGEVIKQLQQFDGSTPFDPNQYVMFINCEGGCVSFTEIRETG